MNFTKNDLKTGHLVVTRGGKEYIVFKDADFVDKRCKSDNPLVLVYKGKGIGHWLSGNSYSQSMLNINTKEDDIVAVYKQYNPYSFIHETEGGRSKLIWQRKDPVTDKEKIAEL